MFALTEENGATVMFPCMNSKGLPKSFGAGFPMEVDSSFAKRVSTLSSLRKTRMKSTINITFSPKEI